MNKPKPSYQELEKEIAILLYEKEVSEAKFKAFTEQAPIAIYTTNKEGDCVYANELWLEMAGMQLKDALGKGWLSALHPEDLNQVEKNWYKSIESNGTWRFEYRFQNKNKEITWVEGSAKNFYNEKNELIGYLGTNVNITQRKKTEEILKESEESFREMFRNMGDGVCRYAVIDNGNDFIFKNINTAAEKIAKIKRADVIGKSIFEIRPRSKDHELVKVFKRVWETGQSELFKETFYQDETLSGYYKNFVYKLHSGDIVAIFEDLTESKLAEEALLESEKQQKELNATKDKLISIISHDLRSPFNSILGLTELLLYSTENKDLEEAESLATLISTTTKSTLGLLDNLLNWARAQTNHIIFKPRLVNLNPIIEEVLDLLKPTAVIKSVSLINKTSDQDLVYVDEDMLKAILRNLISNAIKFTNSNGEVVISTKNQKQVIEINVTDNGIGMSEEIQNQLFKIDQQTTTNMGTANETGSGLGLLICKEFVDKNGGEIWVESTLEKGSTFKFTLPAQQPLA